MTEHSPRDLLDVAKSRAVEVVLQNVANTAIATYCYILPQIVTYCFNGNEQGASEK